MEVIINNAATPGATIPTHMTQGPAVIPQHTHAHHAASGAVSLLVFILMLLLLLNLFRAVCRKVRRRMGNHGWNASAGSSRRGSGSSGWPGVRLDRAEALLRERLARSEITVEDFDQRQARLSKI
jgi:hypothetical protein